jgi:hypothetical protein
MAEQGGPVAIWDRDDLFEELDALDSATEGVSVSLPTTITECNNTARIPFFPCENVEVITLNACRA